MKIVTKDAVYVQKNDIGFLNRTDLPLPYSIFNKVFGNGVTIIDNSNRFEFIKFDEESEMEYFKNLDWIVDYSVLSSMSIEEIVQLGESASKEKNNIARTYNAMKNEERMKNQHMVSRCEILDFKMYSLRDVILLKKGLINITLPDGILFVESAPVVKEKGFRRILRKFKRRNRI